MSDSRPDIAALIGSRICHDLISPIGAINNGVNNASARIRFFRLAFGAASEQEISLNEVKSVLRDMTIGGKLSVTWDHDAPVRRDLVRLALLAEQCLESAMPYGGDITISCPEGRWIVSGMSERMQLNTDLWSILADGTVPSNLSATHVHFALLALHSRDSGRAVHTTLDPNQIDIVF